MQQEAGLHGAIIMDGNGRWATSRGLPRVAGHRTGAKAVRRTVESAPDAGISTLTLYAFSSDNWKRPKNEVDSLMRLLRNYLRRETARCVKEGVRVRVVGRRDRLDRDVTDAIAAAEEATSGGETLELRIAVDYSARDILCRAAALLDGAGFPDRSTMAALMARASHGGETTPDVDLLIRTGGEQRLSDFMLWECAYAELSFVPVMWPDFGKSHLEDAVAEFRNRERRFGRVPQRAIPTAQEA